MNHYVKKKKEKKTNTILNFKITLIMKYFNTFLNFIFINKHLITVL